MDANKALTLASAVLVAAACLAGCSSTRPAPAEAAGSAGRGAEVIPVVAAESQYGNVAAQIGGAYTRVTSVMSDPSTDPHSYEVSVSVSRAVASARLIIQNGLGYDSFMDRVESASSGRDRRVIVVQKLLGRPADTANPHLWYDPATMPRVADALAAALGSIDPAHAAYFRSNAGRFKAALRPWFDAMARLRARHPGVPVATTEPVADYLLQAAGARILTPYSFQADIMNGVDPAPQGIATENSLLSRRRVKALVYNEQVTDTLTDSFIGTARRSGVPVVGVYEIMPEGESYQQWMLATVTALQKAVSAP